MNEEFTLEELKELEQYVLKNTVPINSGDFIALLTYRGWKTMIANKRTTMTIEELEKTKQGGLAGKFIVDGTPCLVYVKAKIPELIDEKKIAKKVWQDFKLEANK